MNLFCIISPPFFVSQNKNNINGDNYNYEVSIKGEGIRTNESAGKGFVYSSIFPKSEFADFRAGNGSYNTTNSFIIPIGKDRKIYFAITIKPFSDFDLCACGYRRIGINS